MKAVRQRALWTKRPYLIRFISSCLFLLSLGSCSDQAYKTFNPESVNPVRKDLLEAYVDTANTFQLLQNIKNSRQRIDSLILYAERLKNYNEDIALVYAKMAYNLATDKHWKYARAVSAYRMAVLKEKKAKYGEDIEDALVDIHISKRIFEHKNQKHWELLVNSLIGRLYYRQNKLDLSRIYLNQALSELDHINLNERRTLELKSNILHDLVITYFPKLDTLTTNYLNKSDSIYTILGNTRNKARLWVDLGGVLANNGKFNRADSLFQLAIRYGQENNDKDILQKSYQQNAYSLGLQYYYTQKDSFASEAVASLHECLKLTNANRHGVYDLLGWIYQAKWGYFQNSADADSAIYYSKLGMEEARKEGALNIMKSSGSYLAFICAYENEKCTEILDTTVAFFFDKNYAAIIDTLTFHSRAAFRRTNEVEQREIEASASLRQRNQLLFSGGILVIAILVFLLILQYLQQKRLQARMQALRAQINPHFISNSLNAIENLVNQDQKKEASKYIIHFSRLSRRILNSSLGSITTLDQELKTAEHFLALEQLRFKDKLDYHFDVEKGLQLETIQIPALILQPYLENAIWHGIKPKEGKGLLKILVRTKGRNLECIIEDNGIGREKAKTMNANSRLQHKSVGMQITKERIQSFGKSKGAKVEIIDLYDAIGIGNGTKIIITLPLKYLKSKHDEFNTSHIN